MVVDEHLGADEVEKDEAELEVDCGRRNLDDLQPEVAARVQGSLEAVGHVRVELDEPVAG